MVARITIREQSSDDTTINASAGNGASPAVDTIEDSTTSKNNSSDYYSRGSKEVAVETALTLERLEARRALTKNSERLVLVLVGLPARGKSFLGRKLTGFLNWHGVPCKVFNVGKYRRQVADPNESSSDFFDASNRHASALREKAAELALQDMLRWLDNGECEEEDDETEYDDEEEDGGAAAFGNTRSSTMNPECLKSERYNKGNTNSYLKKIMSVPDIVTSQQLLKRERIAIFDATNSTDKRRQWILDMCTNPDKRPDKPTGCVFIESICDDQELLTENYLDKIANSPDYTGMSQEDALIDLRKRVQKYEDQYETIADDQLSYIKVFNLSSKIMANQIYGRMSKVIMPALMAWNIGTRPIFLCRPGQTLESITTDSEDYVASVKMSEGQNDILELSRNSQKTFLRGYHLGKEGKQFSQNLLEFCRKEGKQFLKKRASIIDMKPTGTSRTGLKGPAGLAGSTAGKEHDENDGEDYFPLQIYTSTMPRATQTVNWTNDLQFELDIVEESNLNPLDKGDFAGRELEEIRTIHPIFYQKLVTDAFHARFPGGESYCDLIKRLDAVIVDLEQQVTPTLVVSHVSVLQMLIAYFRNSPVEKCMDIEVPLHTVIQFTPARGGGWSETVHTLAPVKAREVQEVRQPSSLSPAQHSVPTKEPKKTKKNVLFAFPFFQKNQNNDQESHSDNVLDERKHRAHEKIETS